MNRLPKDSFPHVTLFIIGICIILFACEIFTQYLASGTFKLSLTPSVLDQIGGATSYGILQRGEWFRIFCAPWYHLDIMHLFFNMLALYMCGEFLEPFIEKGWFLSLFLLSAMGGVFFSILFLADTTVSVGASGGIMGLLAASVVVTTKIQQKKLKKEIFYRMIAPLISTLIPIIPILINWVLGKDNQSDGIDHAGHIGGVIVGVILGFVIINIWPRFEAQPRFQVQMSVIGSLLTLLSFLAVGYGMLMGHI